MLVLIGLAKALKAKSLADYTYDTLDLVDFLEELDPPTDLLSATEEDLIAYREDRTEHQDEPISAGAWQRRRALINNFHDCAVEEAKLRTSVRTTGARTAVTSWPGADTSELDVRHLTYEQWPFLRGGLPLVRSCELTRARSRRSARADASARTGHAIAH